MSGSSATSTNQALKGGDVDKDAAIRGLPPAYKEAKDSNNAAPHLMPSIVAYSSSTAAMEDEKGTSPAYSSRLGKLAKVLGAETDVELKALRKKLQAAAQQHPELVADIEEMLSGQGKQEKNAEKLASVLGLRQDQVLRQLKTMNTDAWKKQENESSTESLNNSSSDIKPGAKHQDAKRLVKLTHVLGADNPQEFDQILAETTHMLSELSAIKSAPKAAKVLGVTERHPSLSPASPSSPSQGMMSLHKSAEALAQKLFTRADRKQIDGQGITRIPLRLQVRDGQFLARVFLNRESYRNITISVEITAEELLSVLKEKLKLKGELDDYELVERKEGVERVILSDEILYQVMGSWSVKDTLMFRKIGAQEAELKDPVERELLSRRLTKVANLLGVDSQSAQTNPEFRIIANSVSQQNANGSQESNEQVGRIVKDGWLELIHSDAQLFPYWCYIENDSFVAVCKSPEHRDAAAIHLAIRACEFRQVNGSDVAFEIHHKVGSLQLVADNAQVCAAWLETLNECAKSVQTQKKLRSGSLPPASFGDFKVRSVIGRGRFAKVLLCQHKQDGRPYAIKVITKSKASDAKLKASNETETMILQSIRHPFLMSLEYAFETDDRYFLAMEFANGGELFQHLLERGRFSEQLVRFYAAEILSALQCLHGKGIVYGDLKLENIVLDQQGHIKLIDFGLCRREEELVGLKGTLSGTSEYLSPELLLGEVQTYAADWWAYGVVLFEMLCGFHPFYSEVRSELFERILYLQVELPEGVSESASHLLSRLLIRDPIRRLGSGSKGNKEIQDHPFFAPIDFSALFNQKIAPPFQPKVADAFDVSYFSKEFTSEPPQLTPVSSQANL